MVFASAEAAALEALSGWPGLRTVLAVESIRSVSSAPTKVESEIRYLLTSCPDDLAVLGQAIRSHWAIENTLHWVLDVTFREDNSRVRDCTAARPHATWRCCARSRSTLSAATKQPKPACAPSAGRPPGTIATCSSSWPGSRHIPCQTNTKSHA